MKDLRLMTYDQNGWKIYEISTSYQTNLITANQVKGMDRSRHRSVFERLNEFLPRWSIKKI